MGFSFRPATRENIHLLVGLMGGTGSGKTYSAMRLAAGLANGERFAVIDTEAGRAKHYADDFAFDHGDLAAPFSPHAYLEAILAAEKAGYPVIIVDSMSHEHAGEGGLLDMHEAEWSAKGHKESAKMSAWIKPKMAHKRMVQRLLQLRSHLILCFRAEPKVAMEKDDRGRIQVVDKGWQPISAKGLEFEMTTSFLLHHEQPGVACDPLKLPSALRRYFPRDQPISEDSGRRVLGWANGGASKATPPTAQDPTAGAGVLQMISSAHTIEQLDQVGQAIAGMGLTDDQRRQAREAFRKRKSRLAEAAMSDDDWHQVMDSDERKHPALAGEEV